MDVEFSENEIKTQSLKINNGHWIMWSIYKQNKWGAQEFQLQVMLRRCTKKLSFQMFKCHAFPTSSGIPLYIVSLTMLSTVHCTPYSAQRPRQCTAPYIVPSVLDSAQRPLHWTTPPIVHSAPYNAQCIAPLVVHSGSYSTQCTSPHTVHSAQRPLEHAASLKCIAPPRLHSAHHPLQCTEP